MKRKSLIELIAVIAILAVIIISILLAATLIPFQQEAILSNAPYSSNGGGLWTGLSFSVPAGATNATLLFSFDIQNATPASNVSDVGILLTNQTTVQLTHTENGYTYPDFGPVIYNSTEKQSDDMNVSLLPGDYALSMLFGGSQQDDYTVNLTATLYYTAPLISW